MNIRDVKVADLPLDVRSANALKNEGVDTVGDFLNMNPDRWTRAPNFGRASLRKVHAAIQALRVGSAETPAILPAKYDRDVRIASARREGRTLTKVAREFGLSRERVRAIVAEQDELSLRIARYSALAQDTST